MSAPAFPDVRQPVGAVARLLHGSWRAMLRAPFSWSYLVALWVLGIISPGILIRGHIVLGARDVQSLYAVSAGNMLTHWWSLLTSAFWAGTPGGYSAATLLVVLIGIPVEYRMGTRRFAAASGATHFLGIVGAIAFSWSFSGLMGSWSEMLRTHAYLGPSAFVFGAGMVATASMGTLWRRRLRLFTMALLILLALYSGSFPDVVRLAAAGAGLLLGPLFFDRYPHPALPTSSRREARVLIAIVLAASAVGPVLAGLLPHPVGPLSVLQFLFTNIQPVDPETLQTMCSDPTQIQDCAAVHFQLRAGAGGIFMSILPSVLLLLAADGLRRGRRFAWHLALVLQGLLAALAGTFIVRFLLPRGADRAPGEIMGGVDLNRFHHPLSIVLPLLLPVIVFAALVATRGLFTVPAPARTYSRLGLVLIGVAATLAGGYILAGLQLSGGFAPAPGLAQLLADVPDRFLPLGYNFDVPPAFFPQSTPAVLLYEGIGVLFWAVAGWLLLLSFRRPARTGHSRDKDRAGELLRRAYGSDIAYMTTWDGNSYWFSPDGQGFIAYRVLSGIALTLGGPIGPTEAQRQYIEDFTYFCGVNGWNPCLYSVTSDVETAARALGWGSVEVAQETALDLNNIAFTGKNFQDIRTALNKAAKQGIRAEWTTYPGAPLAIVDQIHAISEEWVADKEMPEMGFTLGGIEEINDVEVRCLLAIDDQHTVHAVTSWLPVYRGGEIRGWTLDYMRRRSTGFRSSMEFLIASAALTLKSEGFEFISLSGAPLARVKSVGSPVPSQGSGALDRLLDWLGATLEPVYGFRSLLAFKAKFQPRYHPLYMVYPDAAALPSIANAITRAYLPKVSIRQRLSLAKRILRPQRSHRKASQP
ncbi:DUF2156 domain-containing protein [Paenarthrobacter sp. Z7-10]|uniref:DUF2156 domain-containing protein n=1 Tax=Paenarthrobacter sp. Z7-10 TaxID=2787635 RepID=UPI0022A8E0B1|nr:DUF2156 domain-containing protein [Paenarthrobacter sp. Z7-10]MCZ2403122.1 DUF2156 domain-containing protein [Paenarthrobacter sp. Z7-10]